MNKKFVACILALSVNMVACEKNSVNKGQETQIQTMQQGVRQLTKEQVNKLLPELCKKVKTILIDNEDKIDKKFDMKNTQVLLVSNISKTAYLINSQDEKYGKKEEAVEYSTDTFKEKNLLTIPYGLAEFQGKETYVFNIDFMSNAHLQNPSLKMPALENTLMQTIVHEGVHLILQRALEGGKVTTAEEAMDKGKGGTITPVEEFMGEGKGETVTPVEKFMGEGKGETVTPVEEFMGEGKGGTITPVEEQIGTERGENYPVLYDARIYRIQNILYYKKALESKNEEDRIKYIKMGNYFYKKYLDMNNEHKNETAFDKIEGQAQYLQYRAIAVLNNLDKDESIVKAETKKTYLSKYDGLKDQALMEGGKNAEFYALGSLAYANIYDMNQEKELNYTHPIQYLLDKYGYTENEGDKEASDKVKSYYDKLNTQLKSRIDEINGKLNNDKYIKINIPTLLKYSDNGSFTLHETPVQYKYNNEDATIEKMSTEVRIGDNRIKLKSATLVQTNGNGRDGTLNNRYVFVPKENVEINKDKLTVQTKEVQIYDAKFIEEKGVYKLVE